MRARLLIRMCAVSLAAVIALYTFPTISAENILGAGTSAITGTPAATDASAVTDIEIANFKEIIKVGETVEITATVKPEEAAGQTVVFSSSNPQVAEVSEAGKITGVSAGTAQITAEAGGYRKTLSLTVKVGTKSLAVNASYLVLNPGATFQLNVSVSPAEADQNISYKSTAKDIVTVFQDGKVTALKPGSGSIVVSTWDTSKIISVIVDSKGGDGAVNPDNNDNPQQISAEELQEDELNAVALKIAMAANDGEIIVDGSECEVISTAILKELYGTDKQLIIHYPEYSILLYGRDIKNIDNKLNTRFTLSPVEQGLELLVNDGGNLPGKLTIELKSQEKYSYLYLYDAGKNAHKAMNKLSDYNRFSVDTSGKYLLRQNKLSDGVINWTVIILIGILALALLIAYIAVKKRHWFW